MNERIAAVLSRMSATERPLAGQFLKLIAQDIANAEVPGQYDWSVAETIQWFVDHQIGGDISPVFARLLLIVAESYIQLEAVRTTALDNVAAHTPRQQPGEPDEDTYRIYRDGIWREIFACLDREPDDEERESAIGCLLIKQNDPAIRAALEARRA